jgi:hypothetical protein
MWSVGPPRLDETPYDGTSHEPSGDLCMWSAAVSEASANNGASERAERQPIGISFDILYYTVTPGPVPCRSAPAVHPQQAAGSEHCCGASNGIGQWQWHPASQQQPCIIGVTRIGWD